MCRLTASRPAACLLLYFVLPAPAWLVARWAALSPAILPTEPEETPELQSQPAAEALPDAAEPLEPGSLRVGDYTIGEASCPVLYGHPDIRY
ncbi:hypothetical protein [Hymenobacter canadensis]|uniref:Uncharacterized protein n=1 Tax=Hymenobacter canadensis TaxID=2999067 RepID=A0ABY7LN13_9BACT|nr:hypothetical protein [Hymenobacter canadensis]WBA41322.1 hypothetical protein O3303_16060 [Hymenobacter canadensis]